MRPPVGLRWDFPRRSLVGASSLLAFAAAALIAACDSADEATLAFAKAVSEQNDRWIEQGERPLADFVLQLSKEPSAIAERRDEVAAGLVPFVTLVDGAITTVRALSPPSSSARACYEAQIDRLESERRWLGELQAAIAEMQDATAVATLQSFPDIGRSIAKADETCSKFVDGLN